MLLFGKTPDYKKSQLIVLAVPWGVTTSFGKGAEKGPQMVAHCSTQMDFCTADAPDVRKHGIYLTTPPQFLVDWNTQASLKAQPVLDLEELAPGDFPVSLIQNINHTCHNMVEWVYEQTKKIITEGKKIAVLGGDHSVSEGALRFMGEHFKGDFGLLTIDAHADLRKAYQGFKHSHASVMYNITQQAYPPQKLVQVGVRDCCQQELDTIQSHNNIHTFFDSQIKALLFEGTCWKKVVDTIIKPLPQKVYVSIDVDGLTPSCFPHTGTPVPGGLSFEQFCYLMTRMVKTGRQIIGFDVVEIANPFDKKTTLPDGYNGARLLYFMCQNILLN